MSDVYEGMDGFEQFADRHLARLLRYALMVTGEPELAADVVQDVMVKAARNWPRIAATEHPYRYVLKMITNEHVSWRRRWAVRTITPVDVVPDRAHDIDFTYTVTERDAVWHRLADLPRQQRAVLVLRYYEQLHDDEIAQVLGCSPSTVRGYAHRALGVLRAELTVVASDSQEIR